MPPEAKKLFTDMLDAAQTILEFTAGKSFADVQQDKMLRSAVYYQFTILGEALSQVRAFDASILDRISESYRIIGFRNQVVHGYSKIDHEITWKIISAKLPLLTNELVALLAE